MADEYVVAVATRMREEMRKAENYVRPESGVVRFLITIADLNALLSNVFYIEPWQSDDLYGFGNQATSALPPSPPVADTPIAPAGPETAAPRDQQVVKSVESAART